MENATTMNRLEKSWQELDKLEVKPDEKEIAFLTGVYERKKDELRKKEAEKTEL